jgi:hypothetical protein
MNRRNDLVVSLVTNIVVATILGIASAYVLDSTTIGLLLGLALFSGGIWIIFGSGKE